MTPVEEAGVEGKLVELSNRVEPKHLSCEGRREAAQVVEATPFQGAYSCQVGVEGEEVVEWSEIAEEVAAGVGLGCMVLCCPCSK